MVAHSWDVLARLPLAVPPGLAERANRWPGGAEPVPPAPSASVILLRDRAGALETYLLHRHARMAFAASMVVFPGGRVDPSDHPDGPHPDGPDPDGPDPLRRCALRETAEETGVRLADRDLLDWAEWTTPVMEPRRFRTRFFVAAMPADQVAEDLSGETDRAGWQRPADALAAADRGELALMPPTRSILLELAESGSWSAVRARAWDREVAPVVPALVRVNGSWVYRYPQRLP